MAYTDNRKSTTFANGASSSGGIDISTWKTMALAVELSAAWTAADIGISGSTDDSTWFPLVDKTGARIKLTGVAASKTQRFNGDDLYALVGYRYFRLDSLNTSTGAAENQGAERALTVIIL